MIFGESMAAKPSLCETIPKAAGWTETDTREWIMKQPHTEQTVKHTDDQQNTGNHKKPDAPDAGGADKFGGTRAGAENVEPSGGSKKD